LFIHDKKYLFETKHDVTSAIVNKTLSKTNQKDFTPIKEYGVWLWSSPFALEKDGIDKIIDDINKNKFNTIYVSIDDFLDIKVTDYEKYTEKLNYFIDKATVNKIKVDVVAGSPEWGQPSQRKNAYKIIKFATDYNKKHNHKIRQIQFDIEPYLLKEYENDRTSILKNFIEFANIASKQILQSNNIGLGFVIPHFYDEKQNWTPKIIRNGVTTSVFNHIIILLKNIHNSSLIIMSYRNYFDGKNGVNEILSTEIESETNNTKIIIAQETGNILPAYTTFYGLKKYRLFIQLNKIQNKYKNKKSFGGIAIHDYKNFILLDK
jgi:hypothetical protein